MISLAPLFCVLVCVLGLGAHAQDLDISLDDTELDISIGDVPNPCEGHQCPVGEKCEPVFTPSLIGFPVAHCVSVEEQTGPCVQYVVSSPISCKTMQEWESVGNTQCMLRGNNQPVLTETKVKYVCPSFHRPKERKFMHADFTCCKKEHVATPKASEKPSEQPSKAPTAKTSNEGSTVYDTHEQVKDQVEAEGLEQNTSDFYTHIIPVILALVVLLAVGFILLVVWQRHQSARRRRAQNPKMTLSFVNPNAEPQPTDQEWVVNPLDTTDKSLLIANKHSRK